MELVLTGEGVNYCSFSFEKKGKGDFQFFGYLMMSLIKILSRLISFDKSNARLADFISTNSVITNRKLLIWDLGDYDLILRKNAIWATAMRLRGYKPYCVICNGISSACIQRGLELKQTVDEWSDQCKNCHQKMQKMAKEWDLSILPINEYIKPQEIKTLQQVAAKIPVEEILHYTYLGINVGELAFSSFNRYMRGYVVSSENIETSSYADVYRQYFFASLVNTLLADRILSKLQPDAVLTSHGIYHDYAPILFLAGNRNIPALAWNSGFSDFLHYFDIPDNKSCSLLRGGTHDSWEKESLHKLTNEQKKELDDFFDKRYFSDKASDIRVSVVHKSRETLKNELNITKDKVVCLFCHVNWDIGPGLTHRIFGNANQWVIESIKKMCTISDIDWIIRIHPGELMNDLTLYSTYDVIKDNFDLSKLPNNIRILTHDSGINTYDLLANRLWNNDIRISGS